MAVAKLFDRGARPGHTRLDYSLRFFRYLPFGIEEVLHRLGLHKQQWRKYVIVTAVVVAVAAAISMDATISMNAEFNFEGKLPNNLLRSYKQRTRTMKERKTVMVEAPAVTCVGKSI